MPWRVFPWERAAKSGEPFSSSYVYPNQGSGRFDLRDVPVLYLAETAGLSPATRKRKRAAVASFCR